MIAKPFHVANPTRTLLATSSLALLKDRRSVFAYLTEKRHYDIGTFKSLEEVRELLEQKKTLF